MTFIKTNDGRIIPKDDVTQGLQLDDVVQCILCEKYLELNNGMLFGGGFLNVSFCFGSKFDGRVPHRDEDYWDNFIVNHIEAYICDECAEKNNRKMRFYELETEIRKIRHEYAP